MKIFTIILSIIALALIVFNFTQVNFDAPFEGDSIIAIITILASLCVIIMMAILRISKRIEQKVKGQK
ncbi:MAG: hypothetical protein P8K68_14635 [Algibacter sp.]|uniref:hypothetical protein n=1 Tax=Algibacter sp. TaxID=1872428 RepID=UPI00261D8E16|nr:hypothetical protein [Algibacter sp.]MDG1730194.1 hypothetical protein [Algibacter sp.]MDG2180003.1 hypothetical protein [Algibacter sp.]